MVSSKIVQEDFIIIYPLVEFPLFDERFLFSMNGRHRPSVMNELSSRNPRHSGSWSVRHFKKITPMNLHILSHHTKLVAYLVLYEVVVFNATSSRIHELSTAFQRGFAEGESSNFVLFILCFNLNLSKEFSLIAGEQLQMGWGAA